MRTIYTKCLNHYIKWDDTCEYKSPPRLPQLLPPSHYWKYSIHVVRIEFGNIENGKHSCAQRDSQKVMLKASAISGGWPLSSRFLSQPTPFCSMTSCSTDFFSINKILKSISGSTHLLKNVYAKVWRKIWDCRPT